MSYTITPATGGVTLIAAQTVTTFAAGTPGQIEVAGATFISGGNPVERGDNATVAGSTTNDGAYIILDVISETELEVHPAPTIEAAVGTVAVETGNHLLTITDEVTLTAALITTGVGESRMFGTVAENIGGGGAGVEPSWNIFGHLFRSIVIDHTGKSNTELTISSEVWFLNWQNRAAVSTSWTIRTPSSDAGDTILIMGDLVSSLDERTPIHGSVFINGYPRADPGGKMCTKIGASLIHCSEPAAAVAMQFDNGLDSGYIVGSILAGVSNTPDAAGTLDIVRNTVFAPHAGPSFSPLGALISASDLLLTNATSSGGVFSAVAETVAEGIEASSAALAGGSLLILFISAANFLDPKEDYSAVELLFLFAGAGRKSYTFNPRFVDINRLTGSSPLAGVEVAITKLTDGHYIAVTSGSVGTYTIEIDGDEIDYVSATTNVVTIRNGLVTEINIAKADRDAGVAANGGQIGGAVALIVNAVIPDEPFTISIVAEPTGGDLVLDPTPVGAAALAADNYLQGPVPGSPFTTDSNGRINTNGVQLTRLFGYEDFPVDRSINCTYRIEVTGLGISTYDRVITLTSPLSVDVPMAGPKMGKLRPEE